MRKFLPYILILIILVGLFSPMMKVQAQTPGATGSASTVDPDRTPGICTYGTPPTPRHGITQHNCDILAGEPGHWAPEPATAPADAQKAGTGLGENLPACANLTSGSVGGCLVNIAYFLFFYIPSQILVFTALIFDAMVALTISTVLYGKGFLGEAWRIVRDFSNIFFILILLYIAIKMILGIGGAEIKKMIVQVIIAALLINFSMFFTQVVIDSSNILALIFYNKITVNLSSNIIDQATGKPIEITHTPSFDETQTKVKEKDLAGGIAQAFDVSKLINGDIFKQEGSSLGTVLKNVGDMFYYHPVLSIGGIVASPVLGTAGITTYAFLKTQDVNVSLYLTVILVGGAIFLFASYAFFIAALAFIGRLIELWMLIIFSPFAFLSLTVPELRKLDWLGWEAWSKRLISISFMAPIFMFFMLVISKIVQSGMIDAIKNKNRDPSTTLVLMLIIIPAVIILTLLIKAVHYAKKGGGQFGEMAVKYGGMVAGLAGGLALGAASGGTAVAARATLGRAGAAAANSGWAKRWEARGWGGEYFRRAATAVGSGSFDTRGIKIAGKDLAGVSGLKSLGKAQEGGIIKRRAEQVKKRQERAKDLEVGEDEGLKQNLNDMERDLQSLLRDHSHAIEQIDKQIETARTNANDLKSAAASNPTAISRVVNPVTGALMTNRDAADAAQDELEDWKQQKNDIRNARGAYAGATINGRSIRELQVVAIPDAKNAIEVEDRSRKWNLARTTQSGLGQAKSFIFSGGQHSFAGAREAAHKIRMEAKLDSGKMNNPPLTI